MRTLVLLASPLLALGFAPAHAEEAHETKPYTLAAVVVTASAGGESVGGTEFAAPGFAPLRVTVADATGTDVSLTVGQDLKGSVPGNISPTEGDPFAVGCGVVDLRSSAVAFDPSKPVSVFVETASVDCPEGIGTTGTVSLFVQQP